MWLGVLPFESQELFGDGSRKVGSYYYFFAGAGVKNCTVTLRPIGNESGLPSKPITASRISRSLLSDGSPVEILFLPIISEILTTDPLSLFPSRASALMT